MRESKSASGEVWKARSVRLGPTVIRKILIRGFLPHAVLLAVAILAALYLRNWGWLGNWRTVLAISGVWYMSSRFIRYGIDRIDDDLPPHTWKDGQVNLGRMNEDAARAEENWHMVIGIWLTVVGTIVAGVLPFALDQLCPFR